jgi:hypothetical protein
MSTPTYQTIKLSKGKHSSPDNGACVMELASMLAGEPFSDHPQSVCPVIGSFLRAYNDSVDDSMRDDLYEYAARVVGSRGTARVERARAQRLLDWCDEIRSSRWPRALLPEPVRSIAFRRQPPPDAIGMRAIRAIRRHTDYTHGAVLALLDQLLAIGSTDRSVREITDPVRAPAVLSGN